MQATGPNQILVEGVNAPGTVASAIGTTTANSTTVTMQNVLGLTTGLYVSGPGITNSATQISAIAGNVLTLSSPAALSLTSLLNFTSTIAQPDTQFTSDFYALYPGYPNQIYASSFGVTGINDGTRDDAALIRAWVAANMTPGQTTPVTLIMPVGDVWFNSLITGDTDGYDYGVRIDASNFTLVTPSGYVAHTNITTAPVGTLNVLWKFKAATGNNSWNRVLGPGRWQHETPGNGNNFMHCIIWGATTRNSVLSGKSQFFGFGSPTVGCCDMSSTGPTGLWCIGPYFERVGKGFVQSSSTGNFWGMFDDITVFNYALNGVQTSAPGIEVGSISCSNVGVSNASAAGITFGNDCSDIVFGTLKVTENTTAATIGVQFIQSGASPSGTVNGGSIEVSGAQTGVFFKGVRNNANIGSIKTKNCPTAHVRKLSQSGFNCDQVNIGNLTCLAGGAGGSSLFCGTGTTDTAQAGFTIGNFFDSTTPGVNATVPIHQLATKAGRTTDIGDASVTATFGSTFPTIWYNTPITADRTVTLSTKGAGGASSNVISGARFRIVRSAAATGAFNVIVGAKNLAAGQWIDVEYDGTAWQEVAFGSL